jgi:hypothetical protein
MDARFGRTRWPLVLGVLLALIAVGLALPLQSFASPLVDELQSRATVADATPPVTTLTVPGTTSWPTTTASFTVSWSATDASGILNYDVQYKDGPTGAWTAWKTAITATSAVYAGTQGHTYFFRARATDVAHNLGAYCTPKATGVPYDDAATASCVYSSGWTVTSVTSAFLAKVHKTTTLGKYVTFTFTGQQVSVLATKGPGRGAADIYLDGATVKAASISTLAGTTAYRQVVYTKVFTTNAIHTIRVVNRGARTDIDGFIAPKPDITAPTISAVTGNVAVPKGTAKTITATAADNIAVSQMKLCYRLTGTTAFTALTMTLSGSSYSATIPATAIVSSVVQYYVQAYDAAGNTVTSPAAATTSLYSVYPLSRIAVSPAATSMAKGTAKTYAATGYTAGNVTIPSALLTKTWSVFPVKGTFSPVSTTSATVTFTATTTGMGTVTAKVGTIEGTAKVAVFTSVPATISASATWTAAGSPYVVDHTDIQAGTVLTIQPGVVVKFLDEAVGWSGSGMDVYGTLKAVGTSASRITFTSMEDDAVGGDTNADGAATAPAAGKWTKIWAAGNTGNIQLDYATVKYGGGDWDGAGHSAAVDGVGDSSLSVKHSSFVSNMYGFSATYAKALTLSGTAFSGNTQGCAWILDPPAGTVLGGVAGANSFSGKSNGIHLTGGLASSMTLPAEGTYTIGINGFTVPTGMALTISPGAVMKFENSTSGIWVNGTLTAKGAPATTTPVAAEKRITFTSLKDDTIGGNTDGAAMAQAPGDWAQINTAGNATTTLDYATVTYGGHGVTATDSNGAAVQSDPYTSTLTINHSAFRSNSYAVRATYVKAFTLANSTFATNTYGCVWITQPPASMKLGGANGKNTYSGAKSPGVHIEGALQSSVTLPAEGVYSVFRLSVPAAMTLTLDPGAVMKFVDPTSILDVSGTLNAIGTAASRITFTSIKDDTVGGNTDGVATTPLVGDWDQILTRGNATTNLDYATVTYASGEAANESAAVQGDGSSALSVKHSTLRSNGFAFRSGYGKSVVLTNTAFSLNRDGCAWIEEPPVTTTLGGNTFSGAKYAGIILEGGVQGSLTLPAEGVYSVRYLTVAAGKTLTIKPGAVLKFGSVGVNSAIDVSGTLKAEGDNTPVKNTATGTYSAPGRIYFTSIKDDTIGGDTAGDGATAGAAGDWEYVRISSTGSVKLRYAVVRYGGSSFQSNTGSAWDGVISNGDGLLDASGCDIYANKGAVTTAYGMAPADTKARDCYWGGVNGPSYPGNASGYLGPNTISFHYDGTKLSLDVDIADYRVGPLMARDQALKDIDTFSASATLGKWAPAAVNKPALVLDMKNTVENPLLVDQGGENLCGPAAIVYELVKRDPIKYVRIVQQCYEQGKFQAKTKWYTNNNAGLYSETPDAITPADWIVMAVMRNASNTFFDFNTGDGFAAITTWLDMQEWSREILGFGFAVWNQASLNPLLGAPGTYKAPSDDIQIADRNFRAGGVSFLLVCGDSVETPATLPVPALPNHWIVYQGDLAVSGTGLTHGYKLNAYSWGGIHALDFASVEKFEAFLWGVVRGANILGLNGN